MNIERKDLSAATKSGLLSSEQAEKLWLFWQEQQKDTPSFKFTHLLYYLGGMIAISAVTIYVTKAWDKLQGYPLLAMSLGLLLLGFGLTHYFLKKELRIPAGIMATFSLAIVPLVVYNIQFILGYTPPKQLYYSDFHTWINWYWTIMELATLLVGIIMLYFYRFPFLLFPISIILWYMSMDLWPFLFNIKEYSFEDHATFTMLFGLVVLFIAFIIDLKSRDKREDYAFWLYIIGVLTFWGGLSSHGSNNELSKFIYCLINVLMLFAGAILNRRVFAVFGTLGILGYLSHLAFSVFADSLGFPLVLIMIGILIIFAAVFFTRMENKIKKLVKGFVLKKLK